MQKSRVFELAGSAQRSDVNRPQSPGLDELRNDGLSVLVITGNEHVQRLTGDLAGDEGGREGGVERLYYVRSGGKCLSRSPPRRNCPPA